MPVASPINSFVPCPGCLVFMTKRCLPRHVDDCEMVTRGMRCPIARAEALLYSDGDRAAVPDCVHTIRRRSNQTSDPE